MSTDTPRDPRDVRSVADLDHVLDQAGLALGAVIDDLASVLTSAMARPDGRLFLAAAPRLTGALAGAGQALADVQVLRFELGAVDLGAEGGAA